MLKEWLPNHLDVTMITCCWFHPRNDHCVRLWVTPSWHSGVGSESWTSVRLEVVQMSQTELARTELAAAVLNDWRRASSPLGENIHYLRSKIWLCMNKKIKTVREWSYYYSWVAGTVHWASFTNTFVLCFLNITREFLRRLYEDVKNCSQTARLLPCVRNC